MVARSFHHIRNPSLIISALLITSSAQLRQAAHSSVSSAGQRGAVPFSGASCRAVRYCAMLCGVVRCGAVPCCAVVSALLYLPSFLLNHSENAPPAQLSPQLYIVHNSAAPCGAVRCRALPWGAVRFHAALCYISNMQQYQVYDAKDQVPDTAMYVFLYSLFSFLQI